MAELTTPRIDFSTLGNLGQVYRDAQNEQRTRQTLADLGSTLQGGGNIDYARAAGQALAGGNQALGLSLFSLGNQNRDFALRERQIGQSASNAAAARELARQRFEFEKSQSAQELDLRRRALENKGVPNTMAEVAARRDAVIAQGHDPNDPGMRAFILSGKMPREDQQPLTATDKKAIIEADEGVLAAQTAIEGLQKAKVLSPQAYAGPGASVRGYATSLFGSDAGEATSELENLITSNALTQLKAIFGGMPTEGERKILLDVQGSVKQPDAVRQRIYDRAIEAANRRLAFNRQRAASMRGGTFYKAGNTGQAPDTIVPAPVPPQPTQQPEIPPLPPGFELVR